MTQDYTHLPWRGSSDQSPDHLRPSEIAVEPFGEETMEQPIAERFAAIASRYPTKIAIDDGVVRLTYAETLGRVRQLAARIDTIAPPGRPVAIVLPNTAQFPVAALACFAAGRPYVPIDLDYPAARNVEILREVGAAAAITLPHDASAAALIAPSLPQLDASMSTGAAEAPPFPAIDVDAPAVILYTSGSTGRPKGICNAQSAILHRVVSFTDLCHFDVDDRFMVLSSPCTIAGLFVPLAALLSGASVRVVELRRVGLDGVQRILRDESISVYWSVPAVLRALLMGPDGRNTMRSLRLVRLGGDVLLEPDLVRFRQMLPGECRIFNGFGSTEVPTTFGWFARPGLTEAGFVPSGYAVPGVDFVLVDEDGMAVPPGEIGELVVRSRYLALGLWQEGRLAPGPFAPDPIDPRRRILATGDLMRLRCDGMTVAFGRKDRQVKIRGVRIDPSEIEAVLRSCPGVADAAVIARDDGNTKTSLVAFITLPPGSARPAGADVAAAVATRLPKAKVPSRTHIVETIPRLPGFKPDVIALAALDRARRDAVDAAALPARSGPSITAGVDAAVRAAWAAALGHRAPEQNRRWEEAGGDSLAALQLLFQLEEMLGRQLPTDVLSWGMTQNSLIAAIELHLAALAHDHEPNAAEDGRQTVFMMPGILGSTLRLAQFRYLLRERVRFVMIDYPDWREAIAVKGDFDAIVDAAVAQILRHADERELYLAGYSFGGFVALAAAQRLVEQGRTVAFLGLLDSFRSRSERGLHRIREPVVRAVWAVVEGLREGRIPLTRLFVEFRAYRTLAAFAWLLIAIAGAHRAAAVRLELLKVLRADALRRWVAKPTEVATVLFRSTQEVSGLPKDYGWSTLCSRFGMVTVGGDHSSMLSDPSEAESLSAAFLEGLRSGSGDAASDTGQLSAALADHD